MNELAHLRTENSKTYRVDGNRYRRVIGSTIHYKDNYTDSTEPWKDVNLGFVNGRIDRAPYILEVKELGIRLTSKKTGTVQTLTLERIGSEKSQAPVSWEFVKNKAIWEHAAPNTDIVIEAGASFVRFKRILHSINAPLEAGFSHNKVVGKADDISLYISARDANGEPLPIAKSDVAGKLTEALDISNLVLKEGKLYRKLQYPDASGEELIEELIEVKFPIVIDPTLTVQPSAKDTNFLKLDPDKSFGSRTRIEGNDSASINRSILEFDISELPEGAVLGSANLQLYYYWFYEVAPFIDPVGKTTWAYKLSRTDWVEGIEESPSTAGATWNDYKIVGETHYPWTAAGGDYVTSDPAGGSTTFPADFGWMAWNVLAIVQDAYDGSIAAEFLVRFETEGLAEDMSSVRFYSNNYTDDTDLCPKLVIDYTVTYDEKGKVQTIVVPQGTSQIATFNEKERLQVVLGSVIGNAYRRYEELAKEQVVLTVSTKAEQLIMGETTREQVVQAIPSSIDNQTMSELSKLQTTLVVIEGDAYKRLDETAREQVILSILTKGEQLIKVETGREQVVLVALAQTDLATFTEKEKLQLLLSIITRADYQEHNETEREQIILAVLAKGEQLIKGEVGREQIILTEIGKTEQLTKDEVGREQVVLGMVGKADIQSMLETGHVQIVLTVVTETDEATWNEVGKEQIILAVQVVSDVLIHGEVGREQVILTVITEADTFFKYLAALKYVLELHNSDGDLVAVLQNAHDISYAQMINSPFALNFALPADDTKGSDILLANEIWLKDYKTGTIIRKFRLSKKRDIRL